MLSTTALVWALISYSKAFPEGPSLIGRPGIEFISWFASVQLLTSKSGRLLSLRADRHPPVLELYLCQAVLSPSTGSGNSRALSLLRPESSQSPSDLFSIQDISISTIELNIILITYSLVTGAAETLDRGSLLPHQRHVIGSYASTLPVKSFRLPFIADNHHIGLKASHFLYPYLVVYCST